MSGIAHNLTGSAQVPSNTAPLWWVRLTQYEYWPWWTLYLPVLPIVILNALRTGRLTYFTAVNPEMSFGGFYGVSKKAILDLVPEEYKPYTVLIDPQQPLDSQTFNITFPIIAKPDVGERGKGVTLIAQQTELESYHLTVQSPYLIQPYIDYDVELAVLYSRMPGDRKGIVSSVTQKDFLAVTGDGYNTIGALAEAQVRARFQTARLQKIYGPKWHEVPVAGQRVVLENIGNHCRGTRFVKANHLIDDRLTAVFDNIADDMPGFCYGRYDLRVRSLDDLYAGKNIRVVELNGVNADPAHIYDAEHGFWAALRDLYWHWWRIGSITRVQISKGVPCATISETWNAFRTRNL
jgi:ATP-grasp domain